MKAAIPPDIRKGISGESLGIEVTTRCNNACTYCFVRTGATRSSDLPLEAVLEIIAEGCRLGYRNLHLSGGEPFLWDGLEAAVDHASRCGYHTILINTNGILLTPEASFDLSQYGNVWVSVSLQGPKAFHCRVRGPNHYALIRDHIAAALDAGLDVSLYTTVFKSLLPSIPGFTRDVFAAYPGLHCLAFIQLIRVPGDGVGLSREMLDPEAFLTLVQMAALLRVCGLQVDVLNNPLAGVAAQGLGLPWTPWSQPLSAPGRVMIHASGAITSSHSDPLSFGRYRTGCLKDVLASPQYAAAVRADDEICPGCRFVAFCRANGMRRPSESYRNNNGGNQPFCQRVLARASCRLDSLAESEVVGASDM